MTMRKIYLLLFLACAIATTVTAQTEVTVAPGDSTLEAAIATAIESGTIETTTFVLSRGGEYLLTDAIEFGEVSLTIVAEEGTGNRPEIVPKEKNRPFRTEGDLTLRGIFVNGMSKTLESDNHLIDVREQGTITIDDCIISGNYRSSFRIRREGTVVNVTNSVISNIVGADLEEDADGLDLQTGAVGTDEDRAGIVFRDQGPSQITVENTTFYNVGDVVYSNNSDDINANAISFNNCTFANVGQDGFRLGQTVASTITNNQFINVGLLGSLNANSEDPIEQNVYGISLTETEGQTATISNNNFYLDPVYVASLPDTSNQVINLNPVAESLADTESFLNENVVFNTFPEGYSYTTGWTRMAEGDFGYSQGFASYTGGTGGSVIGDTNYSFAELEATVVSVTPGDGTLEAAIATAMENATISVTVFELQRGGEYLLEDAIEIGEIPLTIVAAEGDGDRPELVPKEKSRPFRTESNLTLRGLFVNGMSKTEESDNHLIDVREEGIITIDDCKISGNYRSAFRIRREGTIVNVTNSVISNIIGAEVEENAEGLDLQTGEVGTEEDRTGIVFRDQGPSSITVENTSFYNIGDVVYSNNSDGVNSNPISFNNCTFVNVGQDGFRLEQTVTTTITNSQFVNVGLLGSLNASSEDPLEQNVYAIGLTEVEGQTATISNNNFYLDPAYISSLPDTSNQVITYNPTAEALATTDSDLNESVVFNTLPDGYSYTTGWDRMAEGDFGYAQELASYTGGISGVIIGDTNWTFEGEDPVLGIQDILSINIYPNPANHYIAFDLNDQSERIQNVEIFSFAGLLVKKIDETEFSNNVSGVRIDVTDLTRGLYFTRIQLSDGKVYGNKIILR